MRRRDFFTSIAFGFLALFVRRSTQAKLYLKSGLAEGRPVPAGMYISQVVGRGRPIRPQERIPILHLRSVTKDE